MSNFSPFLPAGKSFSNSVGVASQICPINFSDLGINQNPSQVQLVNNGTSDIWVVFSNTNAPVAAFPVAGTTTTGTVAAGVRVKPGQTLVYTLNATAASGVPSVANPNVPGPGVYMATIALAAAQVLDVTFGEGN